MFTSAACPKCESLLPPTAADTLPTHCPACGSRVTCPCCGELLKRDAQDTDTLRCPRCNARLREGDTVAEGLPARVAPTSAPDIPGFEVRGEVGRGGMGIVYRARQLSLQRDVAIKVLPPILASDPGRLERFRNEATLAAQLTDSHVLPVFDIQEVQGVPLLIMPFIEGSDLGKILYQRELIRAEKAVPDAHPLALLDDQAYLDKLLPSLDQVVDAVTVIHAAHILHRDIKPSNVLMDQRGNVWLSDFGLARLEESGVGTQTGAGMGTRGFASPEQARGEEIDVRADLFSLGATLYKALTLEMPYGRYGPSDTDILPPPMSRLQGLLGSDFDVVLLKALEVDRERRYASAAEFRDDWHRVRQGLIPRARLMSRSGRFARWTRRHARTLIALFIVALLAGMFGFLSRQPPDPRIYRRVRVETQPAGARIALVPLDEDDGFPIADQAIRPKDRTPVTIPRVPVGEYLVVADLADHGFHEVFRIVPRAKQKPARVNLHESWIEDDVGTVVWHTIKIPSSKEATKGMAFFAGGDYTVGMDKLEVPPYRRQVEGFYLDTTEVSVKLYRSVIEIIPEKLKENLPPDDSYAACWLTYDQALNCAEKLGKRLPDEGEFEYAATEGGKRLYPWGDGPVPDKAWPIGPVGKPAFDHTATDPPVYGLFSNVAEWTMSRRAPYPGVARDLIEILNSTPEDQAKSRAVRMVRGGPFPVVVGDPNPPPGGHPGQWDPRYRHGITRDDAYKALGFRCARSAQPRFLEP